MEAALFTPLKIRNVTFKNRIGISPMCQYSSEDGFFNEWHLSHLGSRATGGAGLVIFEATAVEPEGRISPNDAGLWKDEHIHYAKVIVDFLKSQGSVAGIQLGHAGRKASAAAPWKGDQHLKNEEGGWDTKAPSAIQFDPNQLWKIPTAISLEEIQNIQDKFVEAAKRAVKAGFQVIEIHAAHGYLIHEFYSPLSNKRNDHYGGSFENRIRFLTEITQKIKSVIPEDVLLFVRLSVTDWKDNKDDKEEEEKGWTIDDSVKLSQILKELGVDLIDCSSGFVIPNYKDIPFGPSFQVPFSERIKKESNIATAAVGFLSDAKQVNEIIESEKADLVLFARESLKNPFLPFAFAQELNVKDPAKVLSNQYHFWLQSRN